MNTKATIQTIGGILAILVVAFGAKNWLDKAHASAKEMSDMTVVVTSLVDRVELTDLRNSLALLRRDCGVMCDQCGSGVKRECDNLKAKIRKLEGRD